MGSNPGLGRSPREGNDNPLQYSSQENSTDRGAWQAMVHGVVKSQTQLSTVTYSTVFYFVIYGLKSSLTTKEKLRFGRALVLQFTAPPTLNNFKWRMAYK